MNDRPTASTITDPQLDALHDQLDKVRSAAVLHRQGLITTAELYAVIGPENGPADAAEAAVARCAEHDGPCFPDPTAKCPAHGDKQCAHCHRNPSSCADREYVECGFWSATGMHWDTCSNRIRGPLVEDWRPTSKEQP